MPLEYALQYKGKYPDSGPWKFPRPINLRSNVPIGIGDLQTIKQQKAKQFHFNLMVAGESGLGKTTFLNTLFNSPLTENIMPSDLLQSKTVEISENNYELTENGVKLLLTVVDTPGFGDQLNRETNFEIILNYIDKQYETFLKAESSPGIRSTFQDTRIHCVLYFLPPSGMKGIKDLDREFLQRICDKANVIPVIAKADTLTAEEVGALKQKILRDFDRHDIKSYPSFHAEDREFITDVEKHIPFTVIGSDKLVNVDGKMVRGRSYRWGSVQVENPSHCDFIHLRKLLMDQNMIDLVDTTHKIHYYKYRAVKLKEAGHFERYLECDDAIETSIEEKQQALALEFQEKEEQMRQRFVAKVKEKETALKEREEQLSANRQRLLDELEVLRKAVDSERVLYEELMALKSKK